MFKKFFIHFNNLSIIRVVFLSILIGTFSNASPLWAASRGIDETHLEETKKEATLILKSIIAEQIDLIEWQTHLRTQPQTGRFTFAPEVVDSNIRQAHTNIDVALEHIQSLKNLKTQPHVCELMLSFVSDTSCRVIEELESLKEGRTCFIPNMPNYYEESAKRANILDSNNLAYLKLFASLATADDIEKIFKPFLSSTSVYAGYFLHIQAYWLDLTPTTPQTHGWLYRYISKEASSRPVPAVSKVQALRVKSYKQSLRGFLEGPLKPLAAQDQEIELLWQAYKKGEVTPGSCRKIENAVNTATEEVIEFLIDHLSSEKSVFLKEEDTAPHSSGKKKKKKKAVRPREIEGLEVEAAEDMPSTTTPSIPVAEKEEQKPSSPKESLFPLATQDFLSYSDPLFEKKSDSTPSPESEEEPSTEADSSLEKPLIRKQSPLSRHSEKKETKDTEESSSRLVLKHRFHSQWSKFWTNKFMDWTDFRNLFVNGLDFGYEPIGGSIRKFWYPKNSRKFFIVHEPHGGRNTIGPATLGDIRENLAIDLGWSETSFREE